MPARSNFFRKPFWARNNERAIDDRSRGDAPSRKPAAPSDGRAQGDPQARTAPLSNPEPRRVSPVASRGPTLPASGLLSVKASAAYLGVSPRTLERYRVSGGGPLYRRFGNGKKARVFYHIDDLDAFLSRTYSSTSEYESD